jgi:hypothetical protein
MQRSLGLKKGGSDLISENVGVGVGLVICHWGLHLPEEKLSGRHTFLEVGGGLEVL